MGLEITSTYGRASELCLTKKITSAGDIKDEAGKLYWLIVTNEDGNKRYVTLNNDTGTSNEIARFYVDSDTTKVFNFDPPIPCSTAIRIGTFEESAMIVTGGYV